MAENFEHSIYENSIKPINVRKFYGFEPIYEVWAVFEKKSTFRCCSKFPVYSKVLAMLLPRML